MKQFIICMVLSLFALSLFAQKNKNPKSKTTTINKPKPNVAPVQKVMETKITLGDKEQLVKGALFNTIETNSEGKPYAKTEHYYYKTKTALIITEVNTDLKWNDGITNINTYTLAFDKLNKKACYNLLMDDPEDAKNNYYRLTLLCAINQNHLQVEKLFKGDEKPTVEKISNVTINITNKTDADKWLAEFIK